MKADLVVIGRISKPHGIRGVLKAVPYFQLEQLMAHLERLWLIKEGQTRSFTPQWIRNSGQYLLLKLEGLEDQDAAGTYRGWEIAIPRSELPPLPEGQYYTFQLLGLSVVTEDGRRIGIIRQVLPMPAHDVYLVDADGKEIIIPAVREFVSQVDLKEGRVVVRTIEGLLE